jgi:hypothetical protein
VNGAPAGGGADRGSSTLALAESGATDRLSHGFRRRLAESVDSTGKALAVLAGFGVFFVGAGYFVEWQRFRQGKLPSEQVLPLLPKDQIAAAGARELAISVLFVAFSLAVLGFLLVWLARWSQGRPGRLARGLNRMLAKDVGFPVAVLGGLTLLVVPFNTFGVVVTAILTGLFLYGLLLIRNFLSTGDDEHFPLWRLALAVGVAAIVLAGARQSVFTEARPDVLVCLEDGTSFEGDYLASDSDKVLIRKRSFRPTANAKGGEAEAPRPKRRGGKEEETRRKVESEESRRKRRIGLECAHRSDDAKQVQDRRQRLGQRPQLIVVPQSEVTEILVAKAYKVLRYDNSLLGRIVTGIPWLPRVEFSCIPPECRWKKRRIGPSSYL